MCLLLESFVFWRFFKKIVLVNKSNKRRYILCVCSIAIWTLEGTTELHLNWTVQSLVFKYK